MKHRTSIPRILGLSLVLLTLIPFLPLAYLSWNGYVQDVARVEEEIQATNRQLAHLGANYLGSFLEQARKEALLAAGAGLGAPLPVGPAALQWETIRPDGVVLYSQLSAARVGKACGYAPLLRQPEVASGPWLSGVGRWIEGMPPTVVLVTALPGGATFLGGVLNPVVLHDTMTAWSTAALDRHVYAVDEKGDLVFYSDIDISRRGESLKDNPPIRMHIEGGQGPIRFQSIVSGKQRLGFVERLDPTGWGVIVSADIGSRLIELRDRNIVLGAWILFALVAAPAILLWTSRRLVQPLLQIRNALRAEDRPAHGPLPVSPAARRIAEYDELVGAFDDLSERFAATERELVQAEKASLLGQLASGIAHEIGTPLNVVSGTAQYWLRKLGAEDPAREALQMILKQTERITTMIRRFLDFSRPTEVRLGSVDLGRVIDQTLEMVPGLTGKIRVRVDIDPETPPVKGDPKLLEHAILNLVLNACQAMPEGGALTITVGIGLLEPGERGDGKEAGEWVCCRVADEGCGIPAEDLGKIFDPFFTTKPPGVGTGLGLAIAERIVRQHGGRIEVASRVGKGSVFAVRLRPSRPAPASETPAAGAGAARQAGE